MSTCKQCRFRAHYDKNPRSFLGRLWKFHISFCPGWKRYMSTLPEDARRELAEKYGQKRFLS